MSFSVIIIGAGATGLLAARNLSAAGFSVLLLEAADIPGGRILTLQEGEFTGHEGGFSGPVETGAEFIHGALPITLRLLKEAGISYRPVKGRMAQVRKGKWISHHMFADQWDELMEKMAALSGDMPIADFLEKEFSGERYAGLRDSVRQFAEGYDLADIRRASTKALYAEWQEEGQTEFRIDGGYGRLIHFLVDQCRANGCQLHTSSPARDIRWQSDRVAVTTANGQVFTGEKCIVTVSLGILQLEQSSETPAQSASSLAPAQPPMLASAPLQFTPPIPDYLHAARQLGYGSVIKILLEFRWPFWEEKGKDISFILSDEEIPTWWLQSPDKSKLITGWLTGVAMKQFQHLGNNERIQRCLQSLAAIFSLDPDFLKEQLVASYIADWPATPFIQGGYSFDTVNGDKARHLLCQPIQQTLYFAGEALYEGPSPATVEAAFTSGEEAAEKIIRGLKAK